MRPYRLIFYFFKCYLDRVQYRQSRRTQMSFIYSIHLTILSIVMKSKEEVYLTIWVEHLF